jgi:hypothetical protein
VEKASSYLSKVSALGADVDDAPAPVGVVLAEVELVGTPAGRTGIGGFVVTS